MNFSVKNHQFIKQRFAVKLESLFHTAVQSVGLRISGVRRNYVTWPVFFSIQKAMKEDHDVIYADDQMTLKGSYLQQAPIITAHID